MPKTKISEFSATPGNNTDIDGINIAEGCAPSGINDAIRELMAQLKDFQAGTAGDSFNGPVGTTTAAAGAFTTLSASSTVSGTGFSTYLASPPAIGGTVAAAGSFTTLSASSSVTLSGGTANGVAYLNGSKVLTTGSALTFDGTNFRAVSNARIEGTGVGITGSGDGAEIYSNSGITYFQGLNRTSLTYIPIVLSGGTYIAQTLGGSEQARLTSTGLGIGTSSPAVKLDVSGADGVRSRVIATSGGTSGLILSSAGNTAYTIKAGNADNSLRIDQDGTDRLTLASGGNLGLGVTPSAWSLANGAAIDIGTVGTIVSQQSGSTVTTEFGRNFYYNGTNFIYKVSGGVARYSFGSSAHNWFIAPSGTAGTAISFTQAMTLDASGNLLVGGTSVYGATMTSYASASRSGGLGIRNSAGTAAGGIYTGAAGSGSGSTDVYVEGAGILGFITNGSERARITSGGYFKASNAGTYYGSTGTYHELRNSASDNVVFITNTAASSPYGMSIIYTAATPNGTSNNFIDCTDSTALRVAMRSNGGISNYQANDTNLSDQRLKTDVQPAGTYLDKICAIPVKTFLYKDQTDTERNLGVMAQDVDAVAPELIDHSGFGEAPEGESPYLAVYQTDLQYALMKCIQELKAQNDDLRARVAALETK